MRPLVFALLFLSASLARAIPCNGTLLEPIEAVIRNGDVISLGTVGPGQTIDVVMSGSAHNCGRENRGGTWYRFEVLTVPAGWRPHEFQWMANKMKTAVTVAPGAADGVYPITLRLHEDPERAQGLGTITFTANVTVDRGVLSTRVLKANLTTGVGLPARYDILIENRGDAADTVVISSLGFPAWNATRALYIPPRAKVITFYEVLVNEEKEYAGQLAVTSQSSALMSQTHAVRLTARSSLLGDIRATRYGLLLFPAIIEPFYSLLALIASVLA